MEAVMNKVAVVGAGALGAVYAAHLYDLDPECVCFLADGERLDRLRRGGVIINGKRYDVQVASPRECVRPVDLIIVAVKNNHLSAAIELMKNCVGPETVIISILNGIDSEEIIGAVFGMEKVLYCIALGIDALRDNNRINYTTQGKLFFGEKDNTHTSERVKRIQELFTRAGIAYETPPDMMRMLWRKFMINVGINQASAVLRAPYGVFLTSGEAMELMKSAMREVITLAQKARINLVEEDVHCFDPVLATLNPLSKTSMLQDIEAGRKTELDVFAGRVIELGKKYGVPVPVNQRLFDEIRKIESGGGPG